jgi:hypothetical protein
MAKLKANPRETAETLAIQGLGYIGSDPERLGRFLTLTGLGPQSLRAAAQETSFLAGLLDHIAGDQDLLKGFCAEAAVAPADVDRARRTLGGGDWERDIP